MGGAKAIAEALSKRAKSAKSAQIITWVAGLLVFFDDYANSLIIGPMMRPVTDKMKISRERLSLYNRCHSSTSCRDCNNIYLDRT